MSFEQSRKLDICYRVLRGDLTVLEASELVGKSTRQTRRIVEKVNQQGPSGVLHGNLGKIPKNVIAKELKEQVLQIYRSEYFDYNMTHFLEKLAENHNIKIPHETFRRWAHESGHVKRAHRRRKKKAHPVRPRMSQSGLLLQMDGSTHDWLGNNIKPCLVGCIDDATSKCCYAEFFPAEDRFAVLTVMRRVIEKYGIPEAVYVDQAGAHGKQGIFRKYEGWQDHITDLERALSEMGCRLIFATSPQAKGRIERMWGTFQDRLIPELRTRQINRIPTANQFLHEHFISDHNNRFSHYPLNPNSAWRPIPTELTDKLDEIFCLKQYRKILSGEVISMGGKKYLVQHNFEQSLVGQRIEIRTYLDGTQKFFYADRELTIGAEKLVLRKAA